MSSTPVDLPIACTKRTGAVVGIAVAVLVTVPMLGATPVSQGERQWIEAERTLRFVHSGAANSLRPGRANGRIPESALTEYIATNAVPVKTTNPNDT